MNKRSSFKLKGYPTHATSALKMSDDDNVFSHFNDYAEGDGNLIPEVVIESEPTSNYDFGGGDPSDKSYIPPEHLVSGHGSEPNVSETTKEEKVVDNTREDRGLISNQFLGDAMKMFASTAASKIFQKKEKKDPVRIISGKQTKIA
tara:strand:+ start:978 stop:1415 length:438 start_codon:yes stop_codon:yes gene_type:complete